jgi:class 3 adenylate cyclase
MANAKNIGVTIDLSDANRDLEPETLEALTQTVRAEIGELVEEARLVRESEIPEGGKPGLAGFVLGVLKAEVSLGNTKALLDFLGDRFYGKSLMLEFAANGRNYKLEYRSKQQLEEAVQAIEKLAQLD